MPDYLYLIIGALSIGVLVYFGVKASRNRREMLEAARDSTDAELHAWTVEALTFARDQFAQPLKVDNLKLREEIAVKYAYQRDRLDAIIKAKQHITREGWIEDEQRRQRKAPTSCLDDKAPKRG